MKTKFCFPSPWPNNSLCQFLRYCSSFFHCSVFNQGRQFEQSALESKADKNPEVSIFEALLNVRNSNVEVYFLHCIWALCFLLQPQNFGILLGVMESTVQRSKLQDVGTPGRLNFPIATQKYMWFSFRPVGKNRVLGSGNQVSGVPWRSKWSQFDSFSVGSRGCYFQANACAACQIPHRTASPDNMGCIAAHVNNPTLDRFNLKRLLKHHVCLSYPKIFANNLQLQPIFHTTP